jgi:hypothetical protein
LDLKKQDWYPSLYGQVSASYEDKNKFTSYKGEKYLRAEWLLASHEMRMCKAQKVNA